RPECLHFANGANESNSFPGKLISSTFLGDQFIFSATVNGQPLFGKNRSVPQKPDGTVELRVQPADIMVFAPRETSSQLS
ncbi:MAG: TOBE domain-containing protein, partial [Candidatus Binatia bacterium]